MKEKLQSHFGMILAVIAILVVMGQQMSSPETEYNSIKMEQAVSELEEGSTVKLAEVTPFEWDVCYTFAPYTTKAEIEETIGFHSNSAREADSEEMLQVLFVKDEEVVASECQFPEKIGYDMDFKGKDRLAAKDDPVFLVTKEDDLVILTLAE